MLIALLALSVLNVIAVLLLAGRTSSLDLEMSGLRADVTAMRKMIEDGTAQPGGLRLGRAIPSPAEIQAARNRIDAQGIAHPGGS